jgi:hypothetical protein
METYKVLDDSHKLGTKKVEFQARIDNKRNASSANEWMTAICRHTRVGAQKHTLMSLVSEMFQ